MAWMCAIVATASNPSNQAGALPPDVAAYYSGIYPSTSFLSNPPPKPPPPCPGSGCAPPLPHNPANCTFVLSAATGPGISELNRTGHYLCVPTAGAGAAGAGRLVVFFTGTEPSGTTLLIQAAAGFGFHAIGLSYNNFGAPNGECDVSYPKNQTISDPSCEYDVEEVWLYYI